jgi:hypothetical protein
MIILVEPYFLDKAKLFSHDCDEFQNSLIYINSQKESKKSQNLNISFLLNFYHDDKNRELIGTKELRKMKKFILREFSCLRCERC